MGITDKIADMTEKIVNKNDDDAPVIEPYDEADADVHDGVKDPIQVPSPNVILRNMDASGKQQPDEAD
jgi:hypothetical protein